MTTAIDLSGFGVNFDIYSEDIVDADIYDMRVTANLDTGETDSSFSVEVNIISIVPSTTIPPPTYNVATPELFFTVPEYITSPALVNNEIWTYKADITKYNSDTD